MTQDFEEEQGLEAVERLSRDIRDAAQLLSPAEARYLVSTYYEVQEQRIRADAQVRTSQEQGEPNELLVYAARQYRALERNAQRSLQAYAEAHVVGRWSLGITGIGPVLAAGLLAHIDIHRAPTVGHIWRFAGLDPTLRWLGRAGAQQLLGQVFASEDFEPDMPEGGWAELTEDEVAELDAMLPDGDGQVRREQIIAISRMTDRRIGNLIRLGADDRGRVTRTSLLRLLAKRPWNADLKVLCWKIGESFVKTSGNDNEIYGSVYRDRKERETLKNEAKDFAEQARASLAAKRFGVDTVARRYYEQDMLPPARIHLRSQRYAVKLFLSHWHHVAYETEFGHPPPKPYVLDHVGGHVHFIAPPNWE